MTPGIYSLPMEAYLADPCPMPSASAGLLQTLLTKSALHAKYAHPKLSPDYQPKNSDAFDLGTTAHDLVLEGGTAKICVIDPQEYRSKPTKANPEGTIPKGWTNDAMREARDTARANGLTPILPWDYAEVKKMAVIAREFMRDCEIGPLIAMADAEQTMLWQEDGFWFRARPDLWSKDRLTLVNYKTSESAEPSAFIRRMPSLGYDLSAAFYERGARALGHQSEEFFIVQETTPPYSCSLVGLDPAYKEIAAKKLDYAMELWKNALSADRWNAYPLRTVYATPTPWQLADAEELDNDA